MGNRQVVQGVRTGGRSARVRQAILAAALHELIDNGYAALSVEAVASRAEVNKTTIYRRWPTLDDLLVDALTTWSQDAIPGADTGSIETDLLTLGRELADQLNGGRRHSSRLDEQRGLRLAAPWLAGKLLSPQPNSRNNDAPSVIDRLGDYSSWG